MASIFKRGDGRWVGVITVGGRRKYFYGRSWREVEAKLQAWERSGRLTTAEFFARWLDAVGPNLRPSTLASYRTLIQKHILPALGEVKLAELKPLHLAGLYAELSRSGLSGRRVEYVHQVLHKALGDAVRWGLLGDNPAERVDRPKPNPRSPALWTPEQVRRFLAAVLAGEGGVYGELFGFLLASGLRLSEALGLTWADVDLEAGTVTVRRAVVFVNHRPVEGPPKSRAGYRTVSLPAWGVELLRRQAGRSKERVFVSGAGTIPTEAALRKSFLGLCRRLGLPPIRIHDLRHLHISLLALAGVPVKIAQVRAGHSNPQLTLSVYSHVLGDGDRIAAQVLETFVGKEVKPDDVSNLPEAAQRAFRLLPGMPGGPDNVPARAGPEVSGRMACPG